MLLLHTLNSNHSIHGRIRKVCALQITAANKTLKLWSQLPILILNGVVSFSKLLLSNWYFTYCLPESVATWWTMFSKEHSVSCWSSLGSVIYYILLLVRDNTLTYLKLRCTLIQKKKLILDFCVHPVWQQFLTSVPGSAGRSWNKESSKQNLQTSAIEFCEAPKK